MLCAREAHAFKPFGRQYCTVHPGHCHTERSLPTSDCITISTAPPSVRTLREDTGGDRPKVCTDDSIVVHLQPMSVHYKISFSAFCFQFILLVFFAYFLGMVLIIKFNQLIKRA